MIKFMKDIDPGRDFSLMKDLKVEVPKPVQSTQSVYATSLDGDTNSFMNSVVNLRKIFKLSYTAFRGLGQNEDIRNFDHNPFAAAFEEVNFSKTKWFAIYKSVKGTLESKHLALDLPWVQYAHLLASKQGRTQGWITLDQTIDRNMAREDNVTRWPEPHSRSILDHTIFRPEVKQKVPALYIINNKNLLKPYLNHQTDGYHSQTGKYERGSHQSENSQPIFGLFHNQRPLQYENPDSNTVISKKGLIVIQVEMESTQSFPLDKNQFHNRLCNIGGDKVEKIKVQIRSIEAKVGIETQSFEDIDALAREIDEPGLNQMTIEDMLKQIDGSILTENKYIGHSQYTDFKRAIDGNHKNHKKAHRNAKGRADQKDMDATDRQFVAACNFHFEMYQCPKNALMLIKIAKYCNDNNTHVMFVSSAAITWSRMVRSWRGGFLQIRTEIMKNPVLEDFRKDFGLASPDLSDNPTIMEILGNYKLFLGTYRYTPGKDGAICIQNPKCPNISTAVERQINETFYKQLDHQVDAMDLIVLQNDEREPVLEMLVQLEGRLHKNVL